jgi:hypothetical protein
VLFNSIPSIVNLQIIVLFFVFLFAILNTILFSGAFSRCDMDNLGFTYLEQQARVKDEWDCYNYGGEWVTPRLNFDNVFQSILTLTTMQTTEGWTGVLYDAIDAVGSRMQPIRGYNPTIAVLIMAMILVICLLFLNLFVGVVIETFNRENAMLSKNNLLTRS